MVSPLWSQTRALHTHTHTHANEHQRLRRTWRTAKIKTGFDYYKIVYIKYERFHVVPKGNGQGSDFDLIARSGLNFYSFAIRFKSLGGCECRVPTSNAFKLQTYLQCIFLMYKRGRQFYLKPLLQINKFEFNNVIVWNINIISNRTNVIVRTFICSNYNPILMRSNMSRFLGNLAIITQIQ